MQSFCQIEKYQLIYVFELIGVPDHAGCLKIGQTSLNEELDVKLVLSLPPNDERLKNYALARIKQIVGTAGIAFRLLYTECTVFTKGKKIYWFEDHEVHDVLRRSGVEQVDFGTGGREWFRTDMDTVQCAIKAVKEGRQSLRTDELPGSCSAFPFREEQLEAIEMTVKRYKKSDRMLWNAKMRFGKTSTSLELVRRMEPLRTLILTHRPVVNDGWFVEFGKIFSDRPDFAYGSRLKGDSFSSMEARLKSGDIGHYLYFASMQDLRGSEVVGGAFDKNNEIFSAKWDLVIVDEAHEGTQTELGQNVMASLKASKPKVLELSGTPFNLLHGYAEDEIFTWDYVSEQRKKAEWEKNHPGEYNPYAALPRMNIYTYNLGELKDFARYADEGIAFNFREFFRTGDDDRFVHEDDVKAFLSLISSDDEPSQFPFANEDFRRIFRHTLWMVPGVKAARALSALLVRHPVFRNYKIANVAGTGDEDVPNDDALRLVRKAITDNPDETQTITLSCGRLTTGVTVPEWTAVLMLCGSFSTSAFSYMQTIFRVQSPATGGRIKEECYVFDFAPDRTLKVLASVPRITAKAAKAPKAKKEKGTEDDPTAKALRDFLNFCPVIAYKGGKMEQLNVTGMLAELKKAYVERVVRSGFEDICLYNESLMKLDTLELKDFKELKKIIGTTKAIGVKGEIDINRQGLTDKEYEEKQHLENKPKKQRTPEEEARLAELKEKRKVRDLAASILRGISIRMPLIVYGADIKDEEKELTLDNFANLVDNKSWKEFMPRGVTKQTFHKFKKYYDPDIFRAACQRVRALVRSADKLTVEDRIDRMASIFATFRNPDKETVLTPWRVVNLHVGKTFGGYAFFDESFKVPIEDPRFIDLGEITREVFAPESHLLEPNSKSGLYPLYLAYSIYRKRLAELLVPPKTMEECLKIWDKTLKENIFVICKTPMAKSITRRTLVGFRNAHTNIYAPGQGEDIIEMVRNEPDKFKKKAQRLVGKGMNITAIIGNPPYQVEGVGSRKEPVYPYFYNVAFQLSDKVSLISPGRFLFKAGQASKEWMDEILEDKHFKVADYYALSDDVFPSVEIKGGVAITLRDARRIFGKIGVFFASPVMNDIYRKVSSHPSYIEGAFAELVSSRGMYRFSDEFFENHPEAKDALSKGTGNMITTKSFELYRKAFLSDKPEDGMEYVRMFGRSPSGREYQWIRKSYLEPNDYLDSHNLFVTKANGSGAFGEALSKPTIGAPGVGHTDTFLSIGRFKTAEEATNCLKYICSKLARAMLGLAKVTQDNSKEVWRYVPLQDFTSSSDIDWSRSVSEIDRQLYDKYGLTAEERNFIEQKVKPM